MVISIFLHLKRKSQKNDPALDLAFTKRDAAAVVVVVVVCVYAWPITPKKLNARFDMKTIALKYFLKNT